MDTKTRQSVAPATHLRILTRDLLDVRGQLSRWETYDDDLQEAYQYDWEYAIDGWLPGLLRDVAAGKLTDEEMAEFEQFKADLADLAPAMEEYEFTVPSLDLKDWVRPPEEPPLLPR